MNEELLKIESFYDKIAPKRDTWKRKNSYYHKEIEKLHQFLIPQGKKILEIGCGTGDLLSVLNASQATGIDISGKMVTIASKKYPKLKFVKGYAEDIKLNEKFDYIILSDVIGNFVDVQKAFEELHKVSQENTRIIISYYNYFLEPLFTLSEKLGLKMPQPVQNWLSKKDIENFINLANFEVIKSSNYLLLPFYIPILTPFINKYIARLPLINKLCIVRYFVVRKQPNAISDKEYSVSLIIPARNEAGNIEKAVTSIPKLGNKTQIVFVEGHSKDNTKDEILRVMKKYKNKKDIIFVEQGDGVGKADAVRKGIAKSNGDIFMIFDADLTVSPDDLPKFYQAIRTKKAEYIHGSRLVYPMEDQAMRLLNIAGNKFFGITFSYLLDQQIKDTLCGTKVLFRKDYDRIAANRSYFGDFDPFGDFDLIFGASKLNLKMLEIPIRYKARVYGSTNINRFRHGWLLLQMTFFAARKIKFF